LGYKVSGKRILNQGDVSPFLFYELKGYNKEGGEINILKVYLFLPTDEIASFAYHKEGE
jgi:hypothetical protein